MEETKKQFEHVIAVCRDLFAKKLHDYGAAWRIMRPSSVTDQIYIKANRIRSIEVKGVSLIDEGIRPEFIAIVNYGIIGLIQLELGYAEKEDITEERALELYDTYADKALKLMLAKNHDYDAHHFLYRFDLDEDLSDQANRIFERRYLGFRRCRRQLYGYD